MRARLRGAAAKVKDLVEAAQHYQSSCDISGRAHYIASTRMARWNRALGVAAAIAAAVVGTSIIGTLESQPAIGWKIAAGLISILAAVFSSMQNYLKMAEQAEMHKLTGAKYRALRQHFDLYCLKRSQVSDTVATPTVVASAGLRVDAIAELNQLIDKMADLANDSPHLTDKVWSIAEREISAKRLSVARFASQRFRGLVVCAIENPGWILGIIVALILVIFLWQLNYADVYRAFAVHIKATTAEPAFDSGSNRVDRHEEAVDATTSGTAQSFEQVRGRPPLLRAFLQRMPKGGDLHTHLSGAIYAETYIKWAAEDGLCIDPASLAFVEPPCTSGKRQASDALKDQAFYESIIDAMSLRNFIPGRKSGHDQFFEAFKKFREISKRRTGDMLADVASRAAAQHITYLEVMLSLQSEELKNLAGRVDASSLSALRPNSSAPPTREELQRFKDAVLALGLSKVVERARQDLADALTRKDERLGCGSTEHDPGCQVDMRFVQQTDRNADPARVMTQLIFAFELVKSEPLVVGLNLVGPEDNQSALREYPRQMAMLDFLWREAPDVKISLHAGELTLGLVPPPDLQHHIRLAVEIGHARRIGHGVSIGYEDDAMGVLRELAQRQVAVEINLASNDSILGMREMDHPFLDYWRAGVPVTISTDDEGISRSDLTNEYERAARSYGLRYDDLKAIARNSLTFSFLPGESLWRSVRPFELVTECANDAPGDVEISDWCQKFLAENERAREQWHLEGEFNEFEKLSLRPN
jgi:adenosine deaminase